MLNIKIYKGVPFQSNYNNVCLFNDTNAVENFLERYKIGTITGVAMFYANENKITLTQYYEDANYMLIEDTNAVRQKKFYFIDNMIFKSASAVEYSIVCDIWNTHSYNIVFEESLCVRAHCDVMNIPQYKVNGNNLKSNKILPFNNAECITNYLIPSLSNYSEGTIVAIVNVQNVAYETRLLYRYVSLGSGSESDLRNLLIQLFNDLSSNQYTYMATTFNYQIIKCYFLPSVNLDSVFEAKAPTTQPYNNIQIGDIVSIGTPATNWHLFYGAGATDAEAFYYNYFEQFTLKEDYIYKRNLNRVDFEGKRIIIGALNDYREIDATGFSNYNDTMQLNLYLLNAKQIEIMLECNNVKINLTSSFEIPFMNDEYILYLNQNQNQINVSNAQNAINTTLTLASVGVGVALSPLSMGASLAVGAMGATGAIAKGITAGAMKNATLDDMKNKFDRLDGINNNCLVAFKYGVGAFTIDDNDYFTIKQFQKFGNETQFYISSYKPYNPNYRSLYNFYYVKFNSVALYGDFNEQVRNILKTIFENGVRIWTDTSEYLNDLSYLKD